MTSAITKMSAARLVKGYESAKATAARYREQAKETMSVAKTALETGGSTFGFAFLRGRYENPNDEEGWNIYGVPPDLGAALIFHAAGFFDAFGKQYREDAHALGNGALCAYLADLGRNMGVQSAQEVASSGRVRGNATPAFGRM